MKRSNTIIFTFLVILTSVLFLTSTSNAQLVGGNIYPINGVENPPTSFNNLTSAVAYLTTNGVTGTGQVIMEIAGGYPGEIAPVLIPSITGTNATLGITFRPTTGILITTSIPGAASPNQHAIRITGSYITLDGRAGGVGNTRDWTIRVTGSGTTGLGQMAVRLDNTNNSMTGLVIRNLIMEGEASNTTGAIFQITGVTTNTISNVTIEENLIQSAATPRGYGMTLAVASNVGNTGIIVRNNVITQFYARGINLTGGFPGIEVYGNEIYHSAAVTQPTTAEFSAFYFSTTASPGTKIYNNYIHDIQLTNGTTAANGIYFFNGNTSGLPIEIFNNRVQIGNGITTTTIPVYGIRDNAVSGSLFNVYYNSILVDGSPSSGTSNSAAFRKEVSNFINLKNNVFFNARSNSGGIGVHWGISVNNTTFASISNNDYFANGTGGVLGTTTGLAAGNKLTISEWNAAVLADVNSVSQNPNFIAGLKINTGIATQLESGGTPVSSITADFEGDLRNVITPDIGADEFAGVGLDLTAPAITYTALQNTGSTGSRTLVVNVTDASGVPTTAPGWPNLYWKINTTGTYAAVTPTSVVGSDYTYSFGTGVVSGDTVYYYIVAQDNATVPNVGAFPSVGAGGFSANPPAASTPPTIPGSYRITDIALAGDYTVGSALFNKITGYDITFEKVVQKVVKEVDVLVAAPENITEKGKENSSLTSLQSNNIKQIMEVEETTWIPKINGIPYSGELFVKKADHPELNFPAGIEGIYLTITAAVADLNLRGVLAPVRFLLTDTLYSTGETYPITIAVTNENKPTASNTVTFKPNTGVTSVITCGTAQNVFGLNGSDYITFDGSNTVGGTTRNLTIVNTYTGSTFNLVVALFHNGVKGATNNTIKNCIIKGTPTTTSSYGLFLNAAGGGFHNTSFLNNKIQNSKIAIQFAGVLGGLTNDGVISGNVIGDVAEPLKSGGILCAYTNNVIISGNEIFGEAAGNTNTSQYGILLSTGSINSRIQKNKIHDFYYTGTSGYGCFGIRYGSDATTVTEISNNFIYDIKADGDASSLAYTPSGIFISSGGNIKIYFNSIFLSGNTLGRGTSYTGRSTCISIPATITLLDIRNNILQNSMSSFPGSTMSNVTYGVYSESANTTFSDINFNDYFVNGIGPNVGYLGGNQLNLTAWQNATGQDLNSISAIAAFTDSTNLHIPNGTVTALESAGTPIALITTDIDWEIRNATKPDIGADEFTGTNPDDILAGDYYIPRGSNPKGFTTLADAITALNTFGVSSAVRFLIDDNLNEVGANLLITRSDLTSTNNLTIKPAATKTPTITIAGCTTTAGPSQYSGISYSGASYITIDGSNTDGGTTRDLTIAMNDSLNGRIGIQIYGNTDYLVFKNFYLKFNLINLPNTSTRGVYANGQASGVADSVVFENCQIGDQSHAGAYAISITGSSGSSLYSSKIHILNNNLYGTLRPVYFFYGGASGTISEISENIIQSPYAPPSGNVVWGILFNTFNGTFNIHGNKLQKLISASTATNGVYGIGTLTSQPGVQMNIYNNFLGGDFQHNGTGIPASVDVISFQDNIPQANVYSNTIVLNNINKPSAPRLTGIRWGGTATVNIKNNIVINENDAVTAYALYNASGTFTSDYNNLYVSGTLANIGYSLTQVLKTFSAWQDTTGKDANSINVAAPFTSTLDFHIPDGTLTPIESGGTPIALVTTDIDGQPRNLSNPDIGADEFAGLLLINAPSNLTAVADTFAVLLSWTDNSTNELGFYIERKNGDTLSVDPFVVIDTVGVDTINYNDLGRTPNTTYTYRVQAFNLLGVSPYSNEVTTTTIIPVELTSFTANASDNEISVVWSTATELNNRGFELERKLDGIWEKVTFIEGRGTTTEKSDYSYSDKFKYDGFQGTVQYRLKQIDFDGTINYSNVISVDVNFTPKEYTLYQNYPNPFNPSTTIKFALPFDSNVRIAVYNLLGEQVEVIFDQVSEVGYHNVSWNASDLASGVYVYTIEAKSIEGSKNFTSVKKMMLLK